MPVSYRSTVAIRIETRQYFGRIFQWQITINFFKNTDYLTKLMRHAGLKFNKIGTIESLIVMHLFQHKSGKKRFGAKSRERKRIKKR